MENNLRDQIAAALVAHHTNGLCPLAGPCADCDCFDPQHTRELDEANAILPIIRAAQNPVTPMVIGADDRNPESI